MSGSTRSGRRLGLASCAAVLGLMSLAVSGCRSAGPPPPDSPVVDETAPVAPPQSFSGSSTMIEARGQRLAFPLPDAKGWSRDRSETPSWVASHPATASRLVVRAWQHDAIARIADCERQARQWRPELPVLRPEDLVEVKQVTLAGSYTSQISVGIVAEDATAPDTLQGHALAFGSDARSCLLLAFSTAASGPGALRVLAERLGVISQGMFGGVRRLQIDERVVVPRLQ